MMIAEKKPQPQQREEILLGENIEVSGLERFLKSRGFTQLNHKGAEANTPGFRYRISTFEYTGTGVPLPEDMAQRLYVNYHDAHVDREYKLFPFVSVTLRSEDDTLAEAYQETIEAIKERYKDRTVTIRRRAVASV